MDGQSPFDISVWKYDQTSTERSPLTPERRFFPSSLIGFCGALIAHALLVLSISSFSSSSTIAKRPASMPVDSHNDKRSDLLFIDLKPVPSSSNAIENTVSTRLLISKMRVAPSRLPDLPPALEYDSLELGSERLALEKEADDKMNDRARWTNIYSEQIQARITRAWLRPRSPIEVGDTSAITSFQCEVQIIQDIAGNVQEILLPNCNGTRVWQQSLVTAIRQSSPLPAPPDQSVFARSITLSFVGLPYSPGEPESDYEMRRDIATESR